MGCTTMHLLSSAVSARNVPITKKCLKGSVQNGGGRRYSQPTPLPLYAVLTN